MLIASIDTEGVDVWQGAFSLAFTMIAIFGA